MTLSQELAFQKLKKYCAYQDRCHQEVRTKLISLKVYGDDLEEIIAALIQENYLDEERFARSYARGKFRFKRWGRNKIKQNLQLRRISSYCIKKGMEEIEEEEYMDTLRLILEKQIVKYSELPELIRKDKAIKYANKRGFEADLIFKVIKDLELNSDILS